MRATIVLTFTIVLLGCSAPGSEPRIDERDVDQQGALEQTREGQGVETAGVGDLDQVVLLDVQALFGGSRLWVAADGKATFSFVRPPEAKGASGFLETRYELVLTAEQRAALRGLVQRHGFFSIKTKQRYGVPDEARPMIYVKSGARDYAVAKWANDTHAGFDPIYRFLSELAAAARAGQPVFEGAYEQWQPAGFPSAERIAEMTALELD